MGVHNVAFFPLPVGEALTGDEGLFDILGKSMLGCPTKDAALPEALCVMISLLGHYTTPSGSLRELLELSLSHIDERQVQHHGHNCDALD